MATCEWYLMCDNEATGTMPHPVLGDVPICDRCIGRYNVLGSEVDDRGVEFVRGFTGTLPTGWAQCGSCGTAWNDDKATAWTPTPAGRCPFEDEHDD